MQRPLIEYIWTHDLAGVQTGVITTMKDLEIDIQLEGPETLYFTIRADDPKAYLLVEDTDLKWRDRRYFIREIVKRRSGSEIYIEVEADATWLRLVDMVHVGSLNIVTEPTAGLAAILSGTGWALATPDPAVDDGTEFALEAVDASVLDLIRKWAKICSLEVVFDTAAKTVGLARQVGAHLGIGFRYGRNVTEIERRANPPIATRLYPFGRNGLTIAGVNGGLPYLEDLSFYTDAGVDPAVAAERYTRDQVWSDESFARDIDLKEAAATRLARLAAPRVSYKAKVIDLSQQTGLQEALFEVGDYVRVTDEPLGFDISTRVVRYQRFPLEPIRNKVELSYLRPGLGRGDGVGARSNSTEEWVLFENRTATLRKVRNGSTILGRINLATIDTAEWVIGYTLTGVGVGTGTVTVTAVDDESGDQLLPAWTIAVTPGAQIRETFSLGETDVGAGTWKLVVRAVSSGGSVGLDIDPNGSAFWILAKGSTQQTINPPNTIRFDYTGAVQHWTVPDDVTEVTITAVGSAGQALDPSNRAPGGTTTAKFPVLAGSVLDIYVGGHSSGVDGAGGCWPNGGNGDSVAGDTAYGGGGSSDVRPAGGAFTSAMIVAGAGGGQGDPSSLPSLGGAAGFYQGQNGNPSGVSFPGGGATQSAGGTAGTGGFAGSAGQGGNAGDTTNAFANAGGGGGGGWFGGGGAGTVAGGGASAGGGGGGSGWIDVTTGAYDLEYEDGVNTERSGYVQISWENPAN